MQMGQCGTCSGCLFIRSATRIDFLAVGTLEPRKNYSFLIDIFTNPAVTSNLIIVGRLGWRSKRLKYKLVNQNQVYWINSCCDGALNEIYQSARAFLSASLDEGFNIPVFEAKEVGLPLILSDISVHKEFHKDEILLSPFDSGAWIEIISQFEFGKYSTETDYRRSHETLNSKAKLDCLIKELSRAT